MARYRIYVTDSSGQESSSDRELKKKELKDLEQYYADMGVTTDVYKLTNTPKTPKEEAKKRREK